MDQVHDLQLQLLQEIGFVWEIDQALSKSLMVEFLRLKVIIGDDLSGALRTWQTDMEVATDKLMRDLDATTQTSTTLPSKNAAVEVALHQFRAASQLRVALPLTQLDEAREEMETFIQFRPYCGVTNENTATAYSHARKHLGITFLFGGCYTKLYKAPQHLSQHMKTCPPCLMNRPEGSRWSVRKK